MAGIYIHVPFCHSKCAYCDFYSKPIGRESLTNFVDTLLSEWHARKAEIKQPFKTLYLGGGTPSILSDDLLHRLISKLQEEAPDLEELTLEVNPEDVTDQRVRNWISAGINRVSMGVQSLIDYELQAVGRCHSARQALEAVDVLQTAGISRISCDLIYGLPEQTLQSWQVSVDKLLTTGIDHLSAYCLSFEPGTRLYARMVAGKVSPASDETIEAMYSYLCQAASEARFEHYEISNFARSGFRSRHNSSYWTETPYLGLGPAAHSFDGKVRRCNPSNLARYLASTPCFEIEELDEIDRLNDIIITRLRTIEGLDMQKIPARYRTGILKDVSKWIHQGIVVYTDSEIRITESGWLMADAVMRDAIREGEPT